MGSYGATAYDVTGRRRFVLIVVCAVLLVIAAMALLSILFPDLAFGDHAEQSPTGGNGSGGAYADIDPTKMFSPDPTKQSPLFTGLAGILSTLTSTILLPVGVFFVSWRCVYLAACPMMMHVDPLNMLDSARYSGNRKGASGGHNGRGFIRNFARSSGDRYEAAQGFNDRRSSE
ncbi:MAG: hypothetical protein BZ138_06410, partial [Methanosphaera sp. rholeuAM270]